MSERKRLPKYLGCTQRTWKARKRREWKAVIAAFEAFRIGCAFTPVYPVELLGELLNRNTRLLSAKEWGR